MKDGKVFDELVLITHVQRTYRASPRLKDADIPEDDIQSLYLELVIDVRKMYHNCRLVHADLSEYNIL